MIKIVTDSTVNLSDEILARYDIRKAPIAIQFGLETFEEDVDMDRDMFYRKIEEMGIVPTSSQPATGRFTEIYQELAAAGHQILSIHVTSKHSGTCQSAILASSLVPDAQVEVFDSASISLGTGYMVLEAVRAVEKGWGLEEIPPRSSRPQSLKQAPNPIATIILPIEDWFIGNGPRHIAVLVDGQNNIPGAYCVRRNDLHPWRAADISFGLSLHYCPY